MPVVDESAVGLDVLCGDAERLRKELFDDKLVDELLAAAGERGVALTGSGGFLPELIKTVLERGMNAELTDHLGYEKGDRAGHGSGNSRNGSSQKTVATWENAWDRFVPFLAFGPALRKVIYTTNSIESLNYQLRKIIKNRGHFPNDDAVIKLLWLAIMNIEDKRARERAKQAEKPGVNMRKKSDSRLIEKGTVTGWNAALGELALIYPERINPHL